MAFRGRPTSLDRLAVFADDESYWGSVGWFNGNVGV